MGPAAAQRSVSAGAMKSRNLLLSIILLAGGSGSVLAATIGPPMLDIPHQCESGSRHNATALSECIVAESEARAEVLQNWTKYSDDRAEKCIKAGRKAKRLPYTAMAKCLSVEAAASGKTGDASPTGKK